MVEFWANRDQIVHAEMPRNVGALLEQSVARYGDKPFWTSVDQPGETLTFSEFSKRTQVATVAFSRTRNQDRHTRGGDVAECP